MSDIGVGDWVETIRAVTGIIPLGSVVLVSDVYAPADFLCDHQEPGATFGVRFANAPNPDNGGFWCGCGVRPIYRPKAELIQSLKAPPVRTREPA